MDKRKIAIFWVLIVISSWLVSDCCSFEYNLTDNVSLNQQEVTASKLDNKASDVDVSKTTQGVSEIESSKNAIQYPNQPIVQSQQSQSEQEKENSLESKISFDAKGMDLVDVLKLIAEQGNLNLIIGKNVSGKVSIFLKDVNVWDAFEIIIAANELAYEKQGNIIKVMTARDYEMAYGIKFMENKKILTLKLKYAKAEEVSKTLNQLKTPLGRIVADINSNTIILFDTPETLRDMQKVALDMDTPLVTKVFELSYGDSEKINTMLQETLTKGVGVIKFDPRTNKIVVIDYPNVIAQVEQIIQALDSKTRQVLIEAKIIQVTLNDEYQMGIDWEYMLRKNTDLKVFNISRAYDTSGSRVKIGATVPESKGDYQFILDMLKTFGDTKTLSTPRIIATSGQEAKILVGSKEVYVSNTVLQGDTTKTVAENINFVDVGVKLYVTPTVNKDGFISMKIRPEVSAATRSFEKQDGTKVPIVETSEAETSVLVKDGVTIILGGLIKNEVTKTVNRVPLLGDIPFLGSLFRHSTSQTKKNELVIFLTPRIISGSENNF